MRGLLRLLREHADAVEADLSRFYHIDYRDRWRFDDEGRRLLTLRMIAVRVKHLPRDSAVGRVLKIDPGWSVTDYLLADVYGVLRGRKHPARPAAPKKAPKAVTRERRRLVAAARRRARERAAAIARGDIT